MPPLPSQVLIVLLGLACFVPASLKLTKSNASVPTSGEWGDQSDGTYANPIVPADFSDLDAIRVGADYYAISSTMQFSPGMAVLQSKDLVNWRVISHVVNDISRLDPNLNWNKMDRYGRGVWAGSIRYHAGKFWVYFNVPDTGFFMSTARDPSGAWTPAHNLWKVNGWDDPCPFWDDDGQGYLVASNFSDGYKIHLFKLSPDGKSLDLRSEMIIHQSKGSEANKLYKFNGFYYHLYSDVKEEGRVVEIERSKRLRGPWEIKQAIHVNAKIDKEPNQGGLIQIPSGKWVFLTHQGTGDWEGRAMVLLPVTWIDGWPIIGQVGADNIGNMIWRADKPIHGYPLSGVTANDDFNETALRPEWEWNYQPRMDKWSLAERPGYLRLRAFRTLHAGDFWSAGNTLTQRSMRTRRNTVTVKLQLSGMANGQGGGIAHFAGTYCAFGVTQTDGLRTLTYNDNGRKVPGPAIRQDTIVLRSTWNFDGQSHFSYSLDGRTFLPFGDIYQLTWGKYRGDRIGLFTFNDRSEYGYLDVDWVRYDAARN